MPKIEERSIFTVSQKILAGQPFALCLCDFLDRFYASNNDKRIDMIAIPPLDLPNYEQIPFLAATTHKLANEYGLNPPEWVFEPRCYAPRDRPYFGNKAKFNLRLLYLFVSPPEFKHRNLFVDANVIMRV
jgi:hypothetical protein